MTTTMFKPIKFSGRNWSPLDKKNERHQLTFLRNWTMETFDQYDLIQPDDSTHNVQT